MTRMACIDMDRDSLIQYALELAKDVYELEGLVIDLYAMVVVELETRGYGGPLGRSFERHEIARRMVEFGFTGRCEDDAAALAEPCQKPAKSEIAEPDGRGGLLGSQADFSIMDELRPSK